MIETRAKFYYGFVIDEDNRYIDFNEGGSELTAELEVGSYTHDEMKTVIKDAFDAAGALTYTVTLNRSTRKFTIAGSGTFSILCATGSHGTVGPTLIGFDYATDRTGSASYQSQTGAGTEYTPQYLLQSYISPEHYLEAVSASVNESADGIIEVVKFGTRQFSQMNITNITDRSMPSGGPITNSATAVADALDFLGYMITKAPFEFIPDVDDADTFYKMILESTPNNREGVGFILNELYDKGLPGFYETGLLKMRVIE